jgi:hypothetical protein
MPAGYDPAKRGVAVFPRFLKRLFGLATPPDRGAVFAELRSQVLPLTSQAAGCEPTVLLPDVWAVVMDWNVAPA